MNKYTIDEVALHDHSQDLWIIIHGSVYNLTSFLTEHPGGEEVLLGLAGQDGTECFDSIGHSDEAKQLREKYKIGEVTDQGSAVQSKTTSADEQITGDITEPKIDDYDDSDHQYQAQTKQKSSLQGFIYSIAIAIYAFIFYYYYQNM
ncbi:Cytochrome b5 [Formica fusca]